MCVEFVYVMNESNPGLSVLSIFVVLYTVLKKEVPRSFWLLAFAHSTLTTQWYIFNFLQQKLRIFDEK